MNGFKIAIFGSGKKGRETYGILRHYFQLEEIVFIDNYVKENYVDKAPVFQADKFLLSESANQYMYLIGGRFIKEMLQQLQVAGIDDGNIYTIEEFVYSFYEGKNVDFVSDCDNDRELIIFDCSNGFVLGGVEHWSYLLASEFSKRQIDTLLYTNTLRYKPPQEMENKILHISFKSNFENLDEQLQQIISVIAGYSKVTFIVSHMSMCLNMVILLKKMKIQQNIKIISVIHTSLEENILENIGAQDGIDRYLCVNKDVYQFLLKNNNMKHKVFYKESPMYVEDLVKTYTENPKIPLKIGYAARLEVLHKRSDLLCDLLEELEMQNCQYCMEIAGDGECYELIQSYIESKGLQNKVKLLGRLDYTSMPEFWKRQDVAINLSETEGCSLTMLESMAAGVVNVVTHTWGCEDFIKDGRTGFLVSLRDVKKLAEKICELERRRDLLSKIGMQAHILVKKRCNVDDYINFWMKKLL